MTVQKWIACGLMLAWCTVFGYGCYTSVCSLTASGITNVSKGLLPAQPEAIQPAETGISVNTATLQELMTLPGIGEARAKAIIESRVNEGSFRYPQDLLSISGIGEKRLAALSGLITTAGEASRSE